MVNSCTEWPALSGSILSFIFCLLSYIIFTLFPPPRLLTLLSQLAINMWSVGLRSLQAKAILIAVSCLSPVRTHTLIPASCRASMVSGTSSCRRSTIPVAPGSQDTIRLGQPTQNKISRQFTFVFTVLVSHPVM